MMDNIQTGMMPKCIPYYDILQITALSEWLASCYLAISITDTFLHP